jgi:DNA-directed RNA polymerase subunit N (RpoN/RPB10)
MYYLRCPSCSLIIGNRQIEYEKKMFEIDNNDKFNQDEKDDLKTKIFDELEIMRYCCRQRIICYIQKTSIII